MTTSAMLVPASGGVLVASASTSLREQVHDSLPDRPWPVQDAMGGADALVKLESGQWQVLFLDWRVPDLNAEELVQIVRRRYPGIQVIMVDSDSSDAVPVVEIAVGGRAGDLRSLEIVSPRLVEDAPNPRPVLTPVAMRDKAQPLPGMIGSTAVMQRLYQLARLVAPRSTTVLILGPTGTGKELLAHALHQLSPRAGRPFVVVNCAAIPESLLESELFGHTRGAFTGAVQASMGRIPAAQGGTLFLDEVGELPLSLQAKLLRFLDQKEVQRLGSAEAVRIDARVVAATNADLGARVIEGKFRSDLFHRLAAFPLELPALGERVEDILALALHFLQRTAMVASVVKHLELSPEAVRIIEAHPWEGNVRELQQVIERAAILCNGGSVILPSHLYFFTRGHGRLAEEEAATPGQP
jgi:DNA-binding NtrC family response regulator